MTGSGCTTESKNKMLTYRVEISGVRSAEELLNRMARDGWRLAQATPNIAAGHGLVLIFEKNA
jgi:acetyl-CoA acetyltransferase